MRVMTIERRNVATLHFYLDPSGKIVRKINYFYKGYLDDLIGHLEQIGVGEVIIIRYKHGLLKKRLLSILKNINVEITFKNKLKVMIVSLKNDNIALEILRNIYKEELWKLLNLQFSF